MKVRIRPLQVDDALVSYKLRNNMRLWKYSQSDTPIPSTLDSEQEAFTKMINDKSTECFAILADEEFVGVTQLTYIHDGTACMKTYILREDLWGKNIASYATHEILTFAFDILKLDVVSRDINISNIAMFKIALNQKFRVVGKSMYNDECMLFQMTRSTWRRLSKE